MNTRILTMAILAAALAVAVVVAACGGDDGGDAPATPAPTTAGQAETAAPVTVDVGSRVGQQGPDLMLTSVDGEQITLSDLRGSPVVLYYFTTW